MDTLHTTRRTLPPLRHAAEFEERARSKHMYDIVEKLIHGNSTLKKKKTPRNIRFQNKVVLPKIPNTVINRAINLKSHHYRLPRSVGLGLQMLSQSGMCSKHLGNKCACKAQNFNCY